jgi:hypothetical protein
MSGESTFVLDSTVSPARSFALSFDPGAFDTLMDTTTLLKETFGLAMPEARGSPHAEEERRADPPAAVEEEEEEEEEDDDGLVPYERERLEQMRRNDEVMRQLGITESVNKLAGKAAPPPEKNPVIIIDDDEDDEAKSDTEDDDEEEEEDDDDDETGGIYGCNRCRFSPKGCYDTPDGKVKGCHPDAHLGPLYLQGLPKRVSVHADTPKKKRKVVYEHEVPPILSPRTKRPRSVPAKYDGGAAARADRASSPKVPPKPKEKELTLIPGLRYIFLTRYGRYAVHFWRRKGEWRQGKRSRYLGTVGTLKEAVEVYNKEARLLGKPTQEIPAGYVAPEPDVPPIVTHAPKHTSSFNDQKKKEKYTTVPGYSGIRVSSNTGRFNVTMGKPERLYLGTVDTLREAVELYNKEAKKRGKPIHPLPNDKLDVPELNKQSTVIPGLQGINMMTVDGKFMAQFYQDGKNFQVGNYDTLDEAVKEQNAAGAAHVSEWVTRKITAEHRAVVKEMERKRELIIAEKAKSRKKLAKQKPAPAIRHHRPRPEPAAKKAAPSRAKTPPRFALVPQESTPTSVPKPTEGAAAAAPVTPPPRVDSANEKRLKDQVNELQDMNRSLLDIAQRAMSMAAKNAQTMG